MDAETARMVVIGIAAVLALIWLSALQVMILATRDQGSPAQETAERFGVVEQESASTIVGEAEVDGLPEELSRKLATLLARGAMGPFGPVKILSCDPEEVVFEASEPSSRISPIRHGRFRMFRSGSRTRIDYALDSPSGRTLLKVGWILLALGLAGLLAGIWLQFQLVLPSPSPQIRGQSVQMLQAIHLIWPPFLLAYLSRQPRRLAQARMEALVNNLPYAR
ncbi:MAG: hypothetical protein JWN86_1550 [Planctomycetota bacterium]|nr:hypothetical protein [Planctomycetota bacterium]